MPLEKDENVSSGTWHEANCVKIHSRGEEFVPEDDIGDDTQNTVDATVSQVNSSWRMYTEASLNLSPQER